MSLRLQEDKDPRFQANLRMNMVRLSAQYNGRLYPAVYIPGTHFC